MAQELLLTFNNQIGELALIPGKSAVFIVRVNGGKRRRKKPIKPWASVLEKDRTKS